MLLGLNPPLDKFFHLSHLGLDYSLLWGHPVDCRMLSSIFGPCSLDGKHSHPYL